MEDYLYESEKERREDDAGDEDIDRCGGVLGADSRLVDDMAINKDRGKRTERETAKLLNGKRVGVLGGVLVVFGVGV